MWVVVVAVVESMVVVLTLRGRWVVVAVAAVFGAAAVGAAAVVPVVPFGFSTIVERMLLKIYDGQAIH